MSAVQALEFLLKGPELAFNPIRRCSCVTARTGGPEQVIGTARVCEEAAPLAQATLRWLGPCTFPAAAVAKHAQRLSACLPRATSVVAFRVSFPLPVC